MKRREMLRCALIGTSVALPPLLSATSGMAQTPKPEPGIDYLILDKQIPGNVPTDKVEVIEFFSYACPHCNQFEPILNNWLKVLPKQIVFNRVPVSFVPNLDGTGYLQRLFYTLTSMGLLDQFHAKVFSAIHNDRLQMSRLDIQMDWVGKHGIDKTTFLEQFNSFSVVTKTARATRLQDMYKVGSVPSFGVAGRFYTEMEMARSMPRAIQIAEYLAVNSRALR